jgi:c-di-GMP-binding flagellar brake protein YcgR
MTSYENIEGPKLNTTFENLSAARTLVKISLAHCHYESLTVVDHTSTDSARNIFTINPPKGLVEAIGESDASRLHFEFNSDDGVTHQFDAEIKNISKDHVCLYTPSFIQRHQQRDNFRVKVIFDSFAKLTIEGSEIRMEIENLSLGGAYCYCANKHKAMFAERPTLEGLELNITMPSECYVVDIELAKVNRMELKPRPKHFGIAFEFVRIKRDAKRILIQQIYELQRQLLQHRLKFL